MKYKMKILTDSLRFNGIIDDIEHPGDKCADFVKTYKFNVDFINSHTLNECYKQLVNEDPDYAKDTKTLNKLRNLKLLSLLMQTVNNGIIDINDINTNELKRSNKEFEAFTDVEIVDMFESVMLQQMPKTN